jgi:hypothetical protein
LAGTAHTGEIGYESLLRDGLGKNYKIETHREFMDDIAPRLSHYIIFITFFDGMRLKGIFLLALSGLRDRSFPFASFFVAEIL